MTDELKDLFAGAVAERPPLPSAPDMLAHARAAERRRTAYQGAGSGAAAVAAIAAVAIAVPSLSGSGSGASGFGSPPLPSSGTPSSQAPPAGRAAVPMSHGQNLASGLTTRLPSAYAPKSLVDYSYAPTTFDPGRANGDGQPVLNAVAVVRITSQGTEGTLAAYIAQDKKPDPTGDLCAPDVATRVGVPAETCQVITVGGKQIRVTTATYAASGRSTSATQFLGDGWLTVTEHLGSLLPTDFTDALPPDANPPGMAANGQADDPRKPPLANLPFTPQQLAEICAIPTMAAN